MLDDDEAVVAASPRWQSEPTRDGTARVLFPETVEYLRCDY